MAGDGKGGTKMSFTMTLFPPIGSDTAEFGYTANIEDGVVPPRGHLGAPGQPAGEPDVQDRRRLLPGRLRHRRGTRRRLRPRSTPTCSSSATAPATCSPA